MQTPTLVADNLTKVIGKKTIVDGVSFTVEPGEVFGFLGPNGAGKTTTIRMLVGLIRPTSGNVHICGYDVERDFEKAMRCIGCIVETPDLYRFMTGRENLEHFGRMLGGVDEGQIERVTKLVNLYHRLDDRVGTYSLGMRQRLGIAQALLGDPKLLILDEPANGLDPAGIREMRELLRSLAAQGLSVFVSSHLLAEIEILCDRVAIIHRGRIQQTSRIDEILAVGKRIELRVDDSTRALALLEAAGFETRLHGEGAIALPIENDQVPRVVEIMAANGVRVFSIAPEQRTLEETFLETTAGESVSN